MALNDADGPTVIAALIAMRAAIVAIKVQCDQIEAQLQKILNDIRD